MNLMARKVVVDVSVWSCPRSVCITYCNVAFCLHFVSKPVMQYVQL